MQRRARAWEIESPTTLLTILALINFLNYVDRYVIAPLVPFLKEPVGHGGLGLSSSQAGALQTAFTVVHSLASIPLGIAADRWLRTRLISIGVALWCAATAVAGFARSFAQIFAARASVGIGEATYAPAASALISDSFQPAQRARALGIFQLGMVIGGAVGMIAGGRVAAAWGWRAAFFVVGGPGIVLALLILFVHEPRRPRSESRGVGARPSGSMRVEAATPGTTSAAALIITSGVLITFFTGAIGFWALDYILRTLFHGEPHHMKQVVNQFGPLAIAAGILGTLTGSMVADRLEKRWPGMGRLAAVAIGVFGSAPCAAVGFMTNDVHVLYPALALGMFFNVWYVGPILAALHDVVPVRLRATATGAYLCLIHLLGDGISPWIVGKIDETASLRTGLLISTAVLAAGGVAALAAMRGSARVAKLKHGALAG